MIYCAVIGDLIDSKLMESDERRQVQERIQYLLDRINFDYGEIIASKFILTLGDEFQGLLLTPRSSAEIAGFLIKGLYPHGIRLGIGLGEIYTDINPMIALGADGPAYHRARECIDRLKTDSRRKNGFPVAFMTGASDAHLLNALCSALSDMMRSWTDRQREIIWTTEECNGRQWLAANTLKISTSYVSRQLKAANYEGYRHLLDSLDAYLHDQYDPSERKVTSTKG